MKESITMSENLNELFCSLAKAQGKIQPACKDKSNPFLKVNMLIFQAFGMHAAIL